SGDRRSRLLLANADASLPHRGALSRARRWARSARAKEGFRRRETRHDVDPRCRLESHHAGSEISPERRLAAMSGFTPDPPPPSHLDAISTRWSVLHQAHHEPAPIAGRARAALAERYGPAIFAYVRAIVRDEHDAEDLAQEIIVRILCGKFSGADPGRGRFRDFLKVAV